MFGRKGVKRIESIESESTDDTAQAEVGFSLDELGSAYEEAIRGAIIDANATDAHSAAESSADAAAAIDGEHAAIEIMLDAPEALESDGVPVTPESILEAMLFVGSGNNQGLDTAKFVEMLRGVTTSDVDAMVESLNELYRTQHRAMEIVRDTGGYRMQLASDLNIVRDRFYGKVRETTLTQSAIDCLALVAYQPGITREEIEKQWNQPASAMLSTLVRKGLLRIDRAEAPAEPKVNKAVQRYYTTDRFLEIIGLDSLSDLPQTEDL
jgi:segregation and condensation protein B